VLQLAGALPGVGYENLGTSRGSGRVADPVGKPRNGRGFEAASTPQKACFCYSLASGQPTDDQPRSDGRDTEPTDEELALVMREARELAVQRRATSDAWVAAGLQEASIFGRDNTQARPTNKSR